MNATELQVYLANTAHQREVADLQAAGLNPILSAHSSGAAVPNVMSGGSGGSDVSARAVDRAFNLAETAVKWNSRASESKTTLGSGLSAERLPGGGFSSTYMQPSNSATVAAANDQISNRDLVDLFRSEGLTGGQARQAAAALRAPLVLSGRQGLSIASSIANLLGQGRLASVLRQVSR